MLLFGHVGLTLGIFYLLNTRLKKDIDYRFLVIGSILSDIIDKPLGNIVLYDLLNNGRIIGHTLLFAVILAVIGLYRKKIMYIAAGVFTHLALDRMWGDPRTLLWPLLGNFEPRDFSFSHFAVSFFEPYNLIGEILGFLAIAYFTLRHRLYKLNNLPPFLRDGKLTNL